MADFSALTQQQRISADIPYKNLALANPAETFLNAWATTTNIKLKQKEFEGRMAQLAARNRALELDSQLDKAKFGLAMEKMELDYGHKATMADIARGRMENSAQYNAERLDLAERRYQDSMDGKGGILRVQNQLDAEGIRPGDPRYRQRVNQLMEQVAPLVPNTVFKSTMASFYKADDDAIKNVTTTTLQDEKDFINNIGRKYYSGNTLQQNLDIIEHPEKLPREKTGWGFWQKETGDVVIEDPTTGEKKTHSMRELVEDRRRWHEIQDRKRKLPGRPDYPKPVPMLPDGRPDASQMVPNEKYDIPGKGTMRWTGTGLVPP